MFAISCNPCSAYCFFWSSVTSDLNNPNAVFNLAHWTSNIFLTSTLSMSAKASPSSTCACCIFFLANAIPNVFCAELI